MKTLSLLLPVALALSAVPIVRGQVMFNSIPSRIVGQPLLQQLGTITATAPNLVEGREFYSPQAVAVDTSVSPPILYVADTNNNRVLAWRNATAFTKGNFADKVIGQRDLLSTAPKGPGTDLSTGLALPLAMAVDKSGNLYVVDAGNNRIVRYPAPFSQTGDLLPIDIIIGQANQSGKQPNEGLANPNEKTLYFSQSLSSAPAAAALAFDAQGNLWATDPNNNRVLRYPASSLTPGSFEVAADTVLGQTDFVSRGIPQNAARNTKNYLAAPSGLAFDPQGRLFVVDAAYRALVFTPPLNTGSNAARLMGIILPTTQVPNPPAINENTLGNVSLQAPAESVFFVGNNPFIVDRGNARILKYDPYDSWPAEATLFSPKAIAVIGQPDFISGKSNQNQPQPSESTFSGPAGARNVFEPAGVSGAVFAGTDLYVVDSGNNRVMVFPQQPGANFTSATRLLGQVDFKYNAVNLIEGRELFLQQFGGSVVVDTVSSTPHLYVSDAVNNRILGYKDYRKVGPGVTADLVIGQPDFYTAEINYPKNDVNQVNDQGLYYPQGVAVDKNGDLWVADRNNGRVLRFPRPFDQPTGSIARANLVLGQVSFFSKVPDASSQTMRAPFGIAFTADGYLVASDIAFNRILYFRKSAGADFTNGQSATAVIGQPDFTTLTETVLNAPLGLALDSDDHLYVADSGNNRIAVYRNLPTAGNDPLPSFSLTGLSTPFGLTVDQSTGELWVADSGSNHIFRYPRFDTLVLNPSSTVTIPSYGPLGITIDPFGSPVVAESINRVSLYYPAIDYTSSAGGVAGRFSGNGANYFARFAPAMISSIFAFTNSHFGSVSGGATSTPLPTTLGDVQVLVNGTAAPLYYVSPGQINLQVPSNAPVSSTPVEFQVVKASTGQILASGLFRIEPVSPGLFTADSSGSGQLLALNQDGTVNSVAHPAKAGTYISFFGTGMGIVAGAPPDGTPNPQQVISTAQKPQVYINGTLLDDADVQYSGLAPGFIGLWQINAKIPANAPTASTAVPVAVVYQGINARTDQFGNGRLITIRTTP